MRLGRSGRRLASLALATALLATGTFVPGSAHAAYVDFTDAMYASMTGEHTAVYGEMTLTALPGASTLTQSAYGLGIDCAATICERRDDDYLIDSREILVIQFDHAVYVETLEFTDLGGFEWALIGGDNILAFTIGEFGGDTSVEIGAWTSSILLSTSHWSDYALAGIEYTGSLNLPGTAQPIPEATSSLLFTAGMLVVGGFVRRSVRKS